MPEMLVFQQFESLEEASRISAILEFSGISVLIENEKQILDSNIIGTNYRPAINLKIAGADFRKAQQILQEKAEVNLDEVDSNYMLLSYTNEELMDVIAKPDEWGYYNYNIATALLKKRGVKISQEHKESLERERIDHLSRPERMSPLLIIIGYAIPCANIFFFVFNFREYLQGNLKWWVFPGIGGILIGAVLLYSKKTLPNGTLQPLYRAENRKHGPKIFYVNALFFLINFTLLLLYFIL